jgi:pimeloyl-ACP methyl ester carboxylesterase
MIALALLGILAAGAGYNHLKSAAEARQYPAPGRFVEVGAGRRLHLDCAGDGPTTVILDAGAGAWSLMMRRLRDDLRDSVRACAYDREGLGWSDDADIGGDAGALADDLDRLIRAAGLGERLILVGHSLGANIAQVHAARHPDRLLGVVLLDPARADDLLEGFDKGDSAALAIDACGARCVLGASAQRIGLIRLASRSAGDRNYSPAEAREYRAGLRQPSHLPTALATLAFAPKTAVQTRAARGFRDLPLTVIYSARTRTPAKGETEEDVARWHAATLDSMRVIASGSSRGRGPVVIPEVTHTTLVLDPAARRIIVAEVLRIARGEATSPSATPRS